MYTPAAPRSDLPRQPAPPRREAWPLWLLAALLLGCNGVATSPVVPLVRVPEADRAKLALPEARPSGDAGSDADEAAALHGGQAAAGRDGR